MKKIVFFLFLIGVSVHSFGQSAGVFSDSIQSLPEVILTGDKLRDFSVGQTLHHLTDSVLTANRPLLTSVLEYNTPVYFKENGLGMVSSPSFRGTTASQTAVLWNGININSDFNGQTDFNTVNTGSYDHISVRAGGGSLVYGSGAIGGTIHLNTDLKFRNEFSNEIYTGFGSFNTFDNRYLLKTSSEKLSFRISAVHNSSDNNYKFKLREGRNTNGRYRNYAVNSALGWKINPTNQLNFYGEIFNSNRHFPLYYLTEIPTKYKDFNIRSLLEWKADFGDFKSNLKTAFLVEDYEYYPDINQDNFSFGKAKSLIAKYDLSYSPADDILLDFIADHQHVNGRGSDIQKESRDITSLGLLFKHQPVKGMRYQLGIRKEITDSYGSPLLFSMGMDYAFTSFYTAKLSASGNFKRPTFNDLYWTESGNTDLDAEKSKQIELGNTFKYRDLKWTLTGYFNDIKDMIHWLPGSDGLFYPRNEDHVQTYGVESLLGWQKQLDKHHFEINTTYAYTISENKKTGKQLIYVPYHKATFSAAYSFGRLTADYQLLYNGEVFMRSDNDPNRILSDYLISNIGIAYRFGDEVSYKIGVRVRNLFDKAYENVRRYELPGINGGVFVNINF